jgi:EAL domain-containing protein (putative c-di-GMP-specific phosphodiesterase class I)
MCEFTSSDGAAGEFPLGDMIRTVFQPIVTGAAPPRALLAFECLSRGPAGTPLEQAPALFARTRALGMEADIDRACAWRALRTAREHGLRHPLFLNVHSVTLRQDEGFVEFLAQSAAQCDVPPARLVLEVVEHDRQHYRDETARALRAIAGRGIAIALDDFGANPGDLELLRCWSPAFVKLDSNLLRWARRSSAARQVIECAVSDADGRGSEVIAEGLEEEADLALAASLGIRHLQGYVVSRPLAPVAAARAAECGTAGVTVGAMAQ